ncbi:Uncharacterised protein [Vibrio cholerae]|nr:Uncharacterised protein [Vibrio cholerae]
MTFYIVKRWNLCVFHIATSLFFDIDRYLFTCVIVFGDLISVCVPVPTPTKTE